MNKKNLLMITNIVLLLAFVTQVATVVMMQLFRSHFVFELHGIVGFILIFAAILHVYLNWWWIKANILKS
jgi:protein-S-isoprenylcysteine O-methyltransferase Ste14